MIGSVVLPEPYQPNNGGFQHETARKLQRARLSKRRRGPTGEMPSTAAGASKLGPDQRRLGERVDSFGVSINA